MSYTCGFTGKCKEFQATKTNPKCKKLEKAVAHRSSMNLAEHIYIYIYNYIYISAWLI